MPITDYNKKKPLEVTSQNDSGTTQDKAQPVIIGSGESDPYNIASASLTQSKDISSNVEDAEGLAFNDDGTKLYIADDVGIPEGINQYNLSTAFDITTASFTKSFDTSSEGIPLDIDFNIDGTKMLIVDGTVGQVYSYNLSTAYDIGTASFSQSFDISSNTNNGYDFAFNGDGTKMYINSTGTNEIVEYSLSTGFDIDTATYNQEIDISNNSPNPDGLVFNGDGTKMFITDTDNNEVLQYSLSTGFDVSTASFTKSYDVSTEDDTPEDVDFNNNGSKMYVCGESTQKIYEYDLGITDSKTGTGDIIVDFSNISGAQDVAVYDQDGNLLDYEIEELDTTAETGVIWAYNSWTRDDTVQAQVAYGDNSANTDRQNVTGTWDNTGQNAVMVQHLNGNATDSTSNNNDGTINGATSTDSGQFDGGYSFDGVDDEIVTTDIDYISGEFTIVAWPNPDTTSGLQNIVSDDGANFSSILRKNGGNWDTAVKDGASSTVTATGNAVTTNTTHLVSRWQTDTLELFENSTSTATATGTSGITNQNNNLAIGFRTNGKNDRYFDGVIDEVRIYSDAKSDDWIQADYDASPKAGQVFFSQQAAETTVTTEEQTFSQDVSLLDEDVTKQFSQTVILENKNIPEQFTQDVAIAETDQTATIGTDVAIQDKDAKKTFTQDVTLFDRDAEKTLSTDVSILTENQEASFDQDVILSAGNIETFSQDVTVKAENQTKQLSTDLILENANIPEQFNQDVNIADKNVEAAFSQDFIVADLDNEETFSQDVYISQRMTATFENSVIIAKQPAPNTRNPLTVETVQGTETFTKVLNPTNTYLNVEEVKKN